MRRPKFILILLIFTFGFLCGMFNKRNDSEKKQLQIQLEKLSRYYQILVMWLEMKQNGKSVIEYLQRNKIKRIAIYGMNALGERFYEEIKNTEIEVVCIIDKSPDLVVGEFVVISPNQVIPELDAIIVAADYYYQEIEKQLKMRVNYPVYSLSGVLGNSFQRYL